MKILAFIFVAIISAMSVSACNTVQGGGKDIEKGGKVVDRAAK